MTSELRSTDLPGVFEGVARGRKSGDHTRTVAIGLGGLQFGGCQINALDLSRNLKVNGFDVVVFAIEDHPLVSVLPYAEQSGQEVVVLPASSNLFRQAWLVARFCRSRRADVVHGFAPWLGPILSVACGMNPRTTAVVTNWTMSNERVIPRDMPLILGTANLVQEADRTRRGSVYLMEPPVDTEHDDPQMYEETDFRRMNGVPSESLLVVIVTRLDSEMKVESVLSLIRAVDAVATDRDVVLAIVGDGDAMQQVHSFAEESNRRAASDRIVVCGSLIDPGIAYAAADIVVGMGGSALRGLAFGKPVVVVGENGFARVFDSDTERYFLQAGFYGVGPESDYGSTDNLLSALRTLLDPTVRQRNGAFGTAIVRQRFSLSAATMTLTSVYHQSVGRRWRRSTQVAYGLWAALRWATREVRNSRIVKRLL